MSAYSRTIFNEEPFFNELCELMGFQSEKALTSAKNAKITAKLGIFVNIRIFVKEM